MKDKSCNGCTHIHDKDCGQIKPVRGTSGSVSFVKVADKRCIKKVKC